MATGTRQIEEFGGLLKRMPWTGLFFLVGALAISGVPPLNGFASEWLTFQALLLGFQSVPGLTRVNFPLAGALLALTSALAAACFVKAFGISFLALPRSRAAAEARESPAVMLLPLAFLAALCLMLGLFPGVVLTSAGRCHGFAARTALVFRNGARRTWYGGRRRTVRTGDTGRTGAGGAWWTRSGGRADRAHSRGACNPPRTDLGLRRDAEPAHRVHRHGVFEAAC